MSGKILILGAGFGGLEAASGLRQSLDPSWEITLIDKNDYFIIGFSKFDVLFGQRTMEQVKAYYNDLAVDGVRFVQDTITRIDPQNRVVETAADEFSYDYLIVALGAEIDPGATPGFEQGGYEFYTLEGAERLHTILHRFTTGTILLSVFGQPYKCPPAPYEAAFLLHDFYAQRGLRQQVDIQMLIPAPVPMALAEGAPEEVQRRFEARGIALRTKHKVVGLDLEHQLALLEGREPLAYDLFIGVPIHRPPEVVRQSPLGQGSWIPVDHTNLETRFSGVYAVGDVTTIPVGEVAVPKAGAFAEDAARVVVSDIVRKITGRGQLLPYKAQGTCFLEFGGGEIAQIEADFLGFDMPQSKLQDPSSELRQGKKQFESDRLERWFNPRA